MSDQEVLPLTLDGLRDQITTHISNVSSNIEFVLVLRDSDGKNHTISTAHNTNTHFAMMHMVSQACESWQSSNIKPVQEQPELTLVPPEQVQVEPEDPTYII